MQAACVADAGTDTDASHPSSSPLATADCYDSPPSVAAGGRDVVHVAPALSSVPASGSFQAFFAHTCSAGLGVVRHYSASSLLAYAEQALVLEQKLATGCFLLQAVLLVEYFMRTTPCFASERERRAQDFVRSFYVQRCWQGASLPLPGRQEEEAAWRAKFAVQLHATLHTPHFETLQPLLVKTCISTLRTLHRAWHPAHLPFFAQLLEYVTSERLGNAIVAASIRPWKRANVEDALQRGEADKLLDEFKRESRRVRAQRATDRATKHSAHVLLREDTSPGTGRASCDITIVDLTSVSGDESSPIAQPVAGAAFSSMLVGCVQELAQQPQALLSVNMPLELEATPSPPAELDASIQNLAAVATTEPQAAATTSAASLLCDLSQPQPVATATDESATIQGAALLAAAAACEGRDTRNRAAMVGPLHRPMLAVIHLDERPASASELDHEPKGDEPESVDASSEQDSGEEEDDAAHRPLNKSRSHPRAASVLKRKRASPSASSNQSQAAAVVTPLPDLPCLPTLSSVPLKLVYLGISAWARMRQREPASERQAMDDALAEFGWDLVEVMRDGPLLEVPEFKRARRGESREAAATYNGQMEGERRCAMLLNMIDKMQTTS